MKHAITVGLLLSATAMCGAHGASPGVLRVTFDNSLRTSTGRPPTRSDGVKLVPGRSGSAAMLSAGASLAYGTRGCYDPHRGTVALWICPNWSSSEIFGDRALWVVDNDPGQSNRTALGVYGTGQSANLYFSNDGGVDAVLAPIDWRKGEWHHVVACWDEGIRYRGLWADGHWYGPVRYERNMPALQKEFFVGYLPALTGPRYEADGAIDDLMVSRRVEEPDFFRPAVKVARDRAKYEAALARLGREFSLERVGREHKEVNWKQLQGGASPLSQLVRLEERFHPSQVYVQPDMSIALDMAIGLGFAVGSPARLPDYDKVTRELLKGYLPIVLSRWQSGDITVDQTAFAFLPKDDEVVSGSETQFAMVRMQLTNRSSSSRKTSPLALVCPKLAGTQTMGYASYQAPASRWQQAPADIKFADGVLEMNGKVLFTCRCDQGTAPSCHWEQPNDKLTNCLKFDVALGPKETRTIDFVLAGTSELYPLSQVESMRATTFEGALEKAQRHWDEALKPSMKLVTPDRRVNDIYRHAVLSNLQFMVKVPDKPWRRPDQTPLLSGMVWPWEAATMMVPMIAAGYHRECDPSIRYFTERQVRVGAFSEDEAPGCYGMPARPDGEAKSAKGAYVGFNPYWMNETGSVLRLMAEQYRYTRDRGWLERNRPSIRAAWEFIQNARNQTKVLDDKGFEVRYYGLMPRGRSHDWPGWRYHPTFTDAFTWQGMSEMAKAFSEAALPEAKKMAADVSDYRKCILDAIEREQITDPKTGLLFMPSSIFYSAGGENDTGAWNLDGPMLLFYVGLLGPTDKRFDDMEAYVDRVYGRRMGICGRMGPDSQFWYVNEVDDCYYNAYLARGEYEKALLVFNSALVYGLSNDTYQAVERIDDSDPGYCPLQPNASSNGRYLEMMRRMVIDEQDADKGILWLLRGCPTDWFAKGKSVVVEQAPTLFGEMALKTTADRHAVTVDIDCPTRETPKELRLVIRRPGRKPIVAATANGQPTRIEGDTVVLPTPRGHVRVVCTF